MTSIKGDARVLGHLGDNLKKIKEEEEEEWSSTEDDEDLQHEEEELRKIEEELKRMDDEANKNKPGYSGTNSSKPSTATPNSGNTANSERLSRTASGPSPNSDLNDDKRQLAKNVSVTISRSIDHPEKASIHQRRLSFTVGQKENGQLLLTNPNNPTKQGLLVDVHQNFSLSDLKKEREEILRAKDPEEETNNIKNDKADDKKSKFGIRSHVLHRKQLSRSDGDGNDNKSEEDIKNLEKKEDKDKEENEKDKKKETKEEKKIRREREKKRKRSYRDVQTEN